MARNEITGYPEPADPGPLFSLPPGPPISRSASPEASPQESQDRERVRSLAQNGNASVPFVPSVANPYFSGSSADKPLPKAGDIAAGVSQGRRLRILQYLANNGPTTIHEFCAACSSGDVIVHAHQVSGRFTDMAKEALLEVPGEKAHPVSGAACNIYQITDRGRQELARMRTQPTRRHP